MKLGKMNDRKCYDEDDANDACSDEDEKRKVVLCHRTEDEPCSFASRQIKIKTGRTFAPTQLFNQEQCFPKVKISLCLFMYVDLAYMVCLFDCGKTSLS